MNRGSTVCISFDSAIKSGYKPSLMKSTTTLLIFASLAISSGTLALGVAEKNGCDLHLKDWLSLYEVMSTLLVAGDI